MIWGPSQAIMDHGERQMEASVVPALSGTCTLWSTALGLTPSLLPFTFSPQEKVPPASLDTPLTTRFYAGAFFIHHAYLAPVLKGFNLGSLNKNNPENNTPSSSNTMKTSWDCEVNTSFVLDSVLSGLGVIRCIPLDIHKMQISSIPFYMQRNWGPKRHVDWLKFACLGFWVH